MLPFRAPGRLELPYSRAALLVGAVLLLGPLGSALQAQTAGPTPIAEVLQDRDRDRVPDRVKETFTVLGTITTDPILLGPAGSLAGLQDRSGGILLYSPDTLQVWAGVKPGDVVQVRGKLRQVRGAEQLVVADLRRVWPGTTPEPRQVPTSDVQGEQYSGQLVQVAGKLIVPPDFLRGKRELILRDRFGEVEVRLEDQFLEDSAFVRQLMDAQQAEVVGIATQSKAEAPFNSGYYLRPRGPEDFRFVPVPPYRTITAIAVFLFLAGLTVHFWLQRRRAETWMSKTALLSESLRESRKALRESEERYALAAAGANDGLWDWDLVRSEIYFSSRWKSILGYKEDEIGSEWREWLSRIHADDVEHVREEIRRHIDGRSSHLEIEYRMLHKEGVYRWVLTRGLAVRNESGAAYRLAGSQTDIHGRKLAEQQILHAAGHDALTGLPNRPFFIDLLNRSIGRAKRHPEYVFAVLFLDFDRFKLINDSLGHVVGDLLLVGIARRLEPCLRPEDTCARLGGDEFVVLLDGIHSTGDAIRVAERIQEVMNQAFNLSGHEVFTSASIGIALSTSGYDEPEELLRDADLAMYRAKAAGKARYEVFDSDMHSEAMERIRLETDLRKARDRGELRVFYQPIVSTQDERITGFEALVRWQHPEMGLLEPAEFIHVADETGLIVQIGGWVLREACRDTRRWQEQFPTFASLKVNVNVSGKELLSPYLIRSVGQVLHQTGLDPSCLKLEITENVMVKHPELLDGVLHQLGSLGIELHMDDFGTGYSSLSHLHRYPIGTMKIDRSFVEKMCDNEEAREIVRTIITLARNLRMEVIAEGVQTDEQLAELRKLGCDYVQGYLFSDPVSATRAEQLLTAQEPPRRRPMLVSVPGGRRA